MILTIENILLVGSILLLISIFAGKTSFKFGVPTLIFFLVIGMLAGSESIGGIYFDDPKIARFIGIIALNFILFSGGLDTSWEKVKPILWQGITLSTLGVFITAFILGIFVHFVLGFSVYEGLLVGAIVSSTDAAAVFSILRSKNLALKGSLRSTLEFESGSNDPMAYFLTVAFLGLIIDRSAGIGSVFVLFIVQFAIGGLFGYLFGYIGKIIINKIKLDYEGLYPVLVIALMFLTFSLTDFLGGNGFLAVYMTSIYLGNNELIHKSSIIKVFDGLAWLMQIVLFVTLGLLVFPSQIFPVIGIGLLISLVLIVVARPVSVFLCLMFFKMKNRNRWFISWVGLRGAVPIVFAMYPLLAGIEKAGIIFNIVFFISVTSVLIQGTTLTKVAKWMHVSLPEKVKARTPVEIILSESEKTELTEIILPNNSSAVGKQIVELGFPNTVLIVLINRNGKYITPKGSTVLEALDVLLVLSEDKEGLNKSAKCLTGKISNA